MYTVQYNTHDLDEWIPMELSEDGSFDLYPSSNPKFLTKEEADFIVTMLDTVITNESMYEFGDAERRNVRAVLVEKLPK